MFSFRARHISQHQALDGHLLQTPREPVTLASGVSTRVDALHIRSKSRFGHLFSKVYAYV